MKANIYKNSLFRNLSIAFSKLLPVVCWLKMNVKKKYHTSSELSIIKNYLFRVRLTDHSPLHKMGKQEPNSAAGRERAVQALH